MRKKEYAFIVIRREITVKNNGEIFKNKLALVIELAGQLGKDFVVVQCPICGMPHEKVELEDLGMETVEKPCEECRKLEVNKLPVRRVK